MSTGDSGGLGATPRRKRQRGKVARAWRRIREPLSQSGAVKHTIAWLLARVIRFIWVANPLAPGSDGREAMRGHGTVIYAVWHGQHVFLPAVPPPGHEVAFMSSKSADSEIGALVAQKLGIRTIRGSGGRNRLSAREKGGARALIAMKRLLDGGMSVGMTAEIPRGRPRQASRGIVLLAKLSGRPIVPIAFASSRRKVFEKSWDKTTISLPFGRGGLVYGEPIEVPADAGEEALEAKQREVTEKLNAATAKAYALADGAR